jgi:hypothetical protein
MQFQRVAGHPARQQQLRDEIVLVEVGRRRAAPAPGLAG